MMYSSNRLSGFAVVKSTPSFSCRHLNVECWVKDEECVVLSIQLLDKQRNPIGSCRNGDGFILREELQTESHKEIPFEKPYGRAKKIFRNRQLHRVQVEISIPESLFKRASHFVLNIASASPEKDAASENTCPSRGMNCIRLEADRKTLKTKDDGHGALFFLVTPAQATQRIDELVRMFPRLRWQDSATSDALAKLWTRMFSGEPPTLTKPLFDRDEIRRVVFGAIKFARRNEFRERTTRSKFQQADDEILDEIVAAQPIIEDESSFEMDSRQLEIAFGHIAEVAGKNGNGELLRRRLQGESISRLADDYGISSRSARVHVSRGRAKLGLSLRTRNT
jgi:hypothetical protein